MFLWEPFPELGRYDQCLRLREHFYASSVVTVWSRLGGVAGLAGPTWCCKGIPRLVRLVTAATRVKWHYCRCQVAQPAAQAMLFALFRENKHANDRGRATRPGVARPAPPPRRVLVPFRSLPRRDCVFVFASNRPGPATTGTVSRLARRPAAGCLPPRRNAVAGGRGRAASAVTRAITPRMRLGSPRWSAGRRTALSDFPEVQPANCSTMA